MTSLRPYVDWTVQKLSKRWNSLDNKIPTKYNYKNVADAHLSGPGGFGLLLHAALAFAEMSSRVCGAVHPDKPGPPDGQSL